MPRKFLVFDTDKSLSVLGGPQRQKEILGFDPLPIIGGIDQVTGFLDKMVVKEEIVEDHPLFGKMKQGIRYRLNDTAQQLGLTGIAIDTLSMLCLQTKTIMMAKKKLAVMDQKNWGIFGDKVIRFLHMLKELDFPVIATCHIKRKEGEDGLFLDQPDIQGSGGQSIGRYFDAVFYAVTQRDNQGRVSYTWQTKNDARRTYCKWRLYEGDDGSNQPTYIEQDLDYVFNVYAEQGTKSPKILILADSGQGKSTSLGTINGKVPQQIKQAA